jgi:sigma-B regulation protein RsbU (phosphoserine phosphatase)
MMLADNALSWLLTPFILKLFLAASVVMVIAAFRKSDSEGVAPWVFAAAAAAVVSDLAALLLPGLPIAAWMAVILPGLAIGAAVKPGTFRYLVGYAVAGVLAGILPIALSSAGLLIPLAGRLAPLLLVGVALILLFALRETEAGLSLSSTGTTALAFALSLTPLSLALAPGQNQILDRLVVPLSYLLFGAALVDYVRNLNLKLVTDRDGLAETIDSMYSFVLKASASVQGGGDLKSLMEYIAQTLAAESGAAGSLIMLVDDFDDAVTTAALHGNFPPISPLPDDLPVENLAIEPWLRELKVKIGEGLIGETAQTGKPAFIADAAADSRVVVHPAQPVGSLIAVPFLIEDRIVGLGLVARLKQQDRFTDADFDRVALLGDFASLIINNVYSFQEVTEKTDIDTAAGIAADIQKALQPKRIADLPTAQFGSFSNSARGVCGDYYDVIVARRDRVYLVMGDVAGKGVPASLIMVMIRAILHLVTNTNQDAATILNWINRGITGKIDIDHFATLQILIYNPLTGDCEYANAGHRPPLIWRAAAGLVDAVEMQSVPIGVEKSTDYKSTRFALSGGDLILLYTDGIVESMNQAGRQYGVKSLTTLLHKFNDLPPKDVAGKIKADVHAFSGDVRQHDDQTLLVMKAKL